MTISLWDKSAGEPVFENRADVQGHFDVAIVGGGYTGLSTALHCAEKGLSCQVLEAESIGFGGSGRNVGLVNAGLWLPPQDVAGLLGEQHAAPLIQTLGDMPDYVFSLIEKHQIRCEAVRSGTIHAAHSPKGLEGLRGRAAEWQRLGAPVELLNREQTEEKTGTGRFFGGLLDRRAGTINPMGYARGLARAAAGAGAQIATGAKVLQLARRDGCWQVTTERGTLTAGKVVIGTNAYTGSLWPGLRDGFTKIRFFQVATEPLGARAARILPEGQGIWDTAPVMFSLRRDQDGRLIIGSMGADHGGLSRRWARTTLRKLFPDLGQVAIEDSWHGQIAMTPDHLFHIHRLEDGLYTPIGYNGRGITTGTLFGRAFAEQFTGGGNTALPVPVTGLKPIAFNGLRAGFYQAAFAANQLARGL